MNAHSSRSHLVVTLELVATTSPATTAPSSNAGARRGNAASGGVETTAESFCAKLQLVDLAGSERVGRTEATGDRLKEAQHINKSLSALGDVIAALGAAQTSGKRAPPSAGAGAGAGAGGAFIPYRNSKLTLLLSDALGGRSKVLMLVTASPTASSASESLSALAFAQRCRAIELGAARRALEPSDAARYRREIAALHAQLAAAGLSPDTGALDAPAPSASAAPVPSPFGRSASAASVGSPAVSPTSSARPSPTATRPGLASGAAGRAAHSPLSAGLRAGMTASALRRSPMGP